MMEEEQQEQSGDGNGTGADEGGDRTLQAWLAGIAIGCLVVAAMIVAYEIGKNNPDQEAAVKKPVAAAGASGSPAPASPEASTFASTCGSCHTLAAADTDATVGPNLDDLQPDSAMVMAAIENGGAGSGVMPAGLLSGEEAQAVADYVAKSAGSGK
jgi:cytochrome c553